MVKGLPALNGDSRSFFSTSASRPGSSAGYKAASRAPSKMVDDLSADETDYTKLVPQQSPRRSILVTAKDNQITDDEDDDVDTRLMSRPPPRAPAAMSAKPTNAKAPVPNAKPVKKAAKKEVAAPSKKNTQSPVAKAYAKRLAKKKIIDSDDDIDAMADDILDSPASDGSEEAASLPARKTAAARPARRAATTTQKTTYTFDDDESNDAHSEEEPSAMYSESE